MVSFIWAATCAVHPGQGLGCWVARLRFFARALWEGAVWRPWLQAPAGSQLAALRQSRPQALGMLVWPYIHKGWEAPARFEAFFNHHRLVQPHRWLDMPVGPRWVLARLDELRPGLSLQVDRPIWFQREGELALNLFVDDLRAYTVAFSLGLRNGERVAYIGGIQGRSVEGANDLYAELTKQMHGCRPRDLLISVLQLICEELGVQRICAVADAQRHHRHPYFAAMVEKLHTAFYDEVWRDRGGEEAADGFFELPACHVARDLAEVPTKKRALYRRRYEMLEQLRGRIRALAAANQPCPEEDVVCSPAR